MVWALVFLLSVIIILLCIKIGIMKASAREIADDLKDWLKTDTNTLITVSSRDKDICYLSGVINDELLNLRNEHLRCKKGNDELKRAITNISHDLRTPLTAICGYTELLSREKLSDKGTRYLNLINDRTDALKRLMEELLSYSIVTSAKELVLTKVNIVSILENSLLGFYGSMKEKGIEPKIDLPEEEVIREVDEGALNRVFENIISNALKYSEGDLKVTMDTQGKIVFENTSKGLDNIVVSRLFDRFYTVESANKSTGLGLSIAKQLTEQMNGTIMAEYDDPMLKITVKMSGK